MALMKNCKIITSGDIRSVVLNGRSLAYRPVLKAIRVKEWATYQDCQVGDLIVERRPECGLKVRRVNAIEDQEVLTESVSMRDPLVLQAIERIDEVLMRWLMNPNEPRTLPVGYGWNGRTRYENQKRAEFTELLSGVMDRIFIDEVLNHAMLSPRENVPTDWSNAVPAPMPVITLPPDASVVNHFVIYWSNNNAILNIYHTCEIKHTGVRIDLKDYPEAERFLIGSVVRNFHGHNVRWKLFLPAQ